MSETPSLVEDLTKTAKENQRGDMRSPYNSILALLRDAAKIGQTHVWIDNGVEALVVEMLREMKLFVAGFKNTSKCTCDYTEHCGNHPQTKFYVGTTACEKTPAYYEKI